ncbi:hypothetical protein D5018_03745 [Parashewanella curva]|uniref:Uncharacterized protein n=1 Tax=Parashewanella curva TaxID=2338552 RepID=A0A3L8Q077_9GAMM|nr:hypothetical protein [Parashewanella curva]RLV60965.1 hypothetical protein D5018_03745 [Parashewanella curva]
MAKEIVFEKGKNPQGFTNLLINGSVFATTGDEELVDAIIKLKEERDYFKNHCAELADDFIPKG